MMIIELPRTRENLGQNNKSQVLGEILFHGPIARAKIATRVGLTQATVSRITRDLIDSGLIEEGEVLDESNKRGRRFIGLRANPTGRFVAGISINVFRQDITLADLTNGVIATKRLQLKDLSDYSSVLQKSARALKQLILENNIDNSRMMGCGIIITGSMDPKNCKVHSAPLLGWENISVKEEIQDEIDFPIFLDSIPNAKNLAARSYGIAKGHNNIVLLNASLAFGCSLIADGHLLRGPDFISGMVGEMLIPTESGELLALDKCGGGSAIVDALTKSAESTGSAHAKHLVKSILQAEEGDRLAINALETAGKCLAFAISNINALLRPELVLLSGPLIESEYYCVAVKQALHKLLGSGFINKSLRFYAVSDQEAARSLALCQSFNLGHMLSDVKPKEAT